MNYEPYKIEDITNKVFCADCLTFMKDIPDNYKNMIKSIQTEEKVECCLCFNDIEIGEEMYLNQFESPYCKNCVEDNNWQDK